MALRRDLTANIDQLLQAQPVTMAGKVFTSASELQAYIDHEILEDKLFVDATVEITNEQHKELLLHVFKHSKDNFNMNVHKIMYGPHQGSRGALGGIFMIQRFEMGPEDAARHLPDTVGRSFAVPSRRVIRTEEVNLVESVRRLFAEALCSREQGYIQRVNGMYFPKYFKVVEGFIKRFPLLRQELLSSITNSFPHPRSEKLQLVCSARNLLSLAALIPIFESEIVYFVINLMSRLDCEVKLGQNREKMDEIMELMILYTNNRLHTQNEPVQMSKTFTELAPLEGVLLSQERQEGSKTPSTKEKEGFVHLLLRTFSEKVVKIEKPMIVHFIYYYISSLGGEFDWIKEAYLQQLIINLLNPNVQRLLKLHSLYYLSSFLRASTFLTDVILHTALSYLLDFLIANYVKYLRRNPQIAVRKLTSLEIMQNQEKRTISTENTSPVGDDIFIFCFQTCLDLFTTKRDILNQAQIKDLVKKLEKLTETTLDFISFSIGESEIFFLLFKNLSELLEDCSTKRLLDELLAFSIQPTAPRFIAPRFKKSNPYSVFGKRAVLRSIDYVPFKPLPMRFYDRFIAPHLQGGWFADAMGDIEGSPFDSSLSLMETSATDNNKPQSPLGKRQDVSSLGTPTGLPPKKYST